MRLIDADALEQKFDDCAGECECCRNHEWHGLGKCSCKLVLDAPTVGGWISVKGRLPEESGKYLVYIHEGYGKWEERRIEIAGFSTDKTKENTYFSAGYGWSDYDRDDGFYEVRPVTHWMPLPTPPEEVSGDE